MAHQPAKQIFVNPTLPSPLAVSVVVQRTTRKVANGAVNEHVARTSIKGEDIVRFRLGRQNRQISDATDVQGDAGFLEWRNKSQSTNGTSGAPCPPTAMSFARKSLTTGMPVFIAMTAGDAIWSVPMRERLCVVRCLRFGGK